MKKVKIAVSGPYKKCRACEGPGVTCNNCPMENVEPDDGNETTEREDQDDGEETMELVTCGSDHGGVTGWVKVEKGGGGEC